MKTNFILNSFENNIANVTLKLEKPVIGVVVFENISYNTIIETVNINGDIITANLEIAHSSELNRIIIYATVNDHHNNTVAIDYIEIPLFANTNSEYSVAVQPVVVDYGQDCLIQVKGTPSTDIILVIKDKQFVVHLDNTGHGEISLNTAIFAKQFAKALQCIQIFIITPNNVQYSVGHICVAAENAVQLAITAQPLMPALEIKTPSVADQLIYPSVGLNETINTNPYIINNQGNDIYDASQKDFVRINSYSYCKSSRNTALIALSSQDINKINIGSFYSDQEKAGVKASRIYVMEAQLGSKYTSPYRNARVIDTNLQVGDCNNAIAIEVDLDIWVDTNIKSIWVLSGSLTGIKFNIISAYRDTSGIWYIVPDAETDFVINSNTCFDFVGVGTHTYAYSKIDSPLPYITVNGYAVSALNPQIATNPNIPPNASNQHVYIIAEGNVNGLSQLFYYAIDIKTGGCFGWQQLTYDGENKNCRVLCDKNGNLHLIWESSRCDPEQLYYGVLGPDSRALINEVLVSSLDKQSEYNINGKNTIDILSYDSPKPINLRELDAYGLPVGDMWHSLSSGNGTTTIINDFTLVAEGNPYNDKFALFATIDKDEYNNYFDGYFSQLSYEITFDLKITCTDPIKDFSLNTKKEIEDLYNNWKAQFTSSSFVYKNINVYEDVYSNRFTISKINYVYDNLIPIVGSYNIPGLSFPVQQVELKHFMLAIVPEKAKFVASNIESSSVWLARTGGNVLNYQSYNEKEVYTGKFKLALITETSANLDDLALAEQKYQVLRMFGEELNINDPHSYRIAIHYTKNRTQTVNSRGTRPLLPEDVLFNLDIIVSVDEAVQCGESATVTFDNSNHSFQIGLGSCITYEYRPFNIKPFDGTLNDNVTVRLDYTNVTIGPQSSLANEHTVALAKADRNVSKMYVPSMTDDTESSNIWDEVYGPELADENRYYLTMGLDRSKVRLSQIPITVYGKNAQPSLCIDKRNKIHVAWQSHRDSYWDIYYTTNTNLHNPFRIETRITQSDSNSLMPSITVDNAGHKLIAWHDNRYGEFQIFSARNTHTIPDDGSCAASFLEEYLGFDEYSDEYVNQSSFANICALKFMFVNANATDQFHFTADFYNDSGLSSLALHADSRYDIANWFYEQNGTTYPMPYNGITVNQGDVVQVIYKVDSELPPNSIYYTDIQYDNGTLSRYDIVEFFCVNEQYPLCHIPCLYTNNELTAKNVHFRVTFYKDSSMKDVVLSTNTSTDNRKWYIGEYNTFPAGGIEVQPQETISVYYNPDILPEELSQLYITLTHTALLCNTTYYVAIETYVDNVYTVTDQFSFECNCSFVNANIWRKDLQSREWMCSGQGGMDILITNNPKVTSIKPVVAAGYNNIVYVGWENRYLGSTTLQYALWDGNNDVFYCQSQGKYDQSITSNFTNVGVLVGDLQHPTFFYTNGNILVGQNFNLYVSSSSSSSSSITDFILNNQLSEDALSLTAADVISCLKMSVNEKSTVRLYHADSETPVSLVNNCKVLLDVQCPHSSYAIRFKNENDSTWSDWIPINLGLYKSSSSSSSSSSAAAASVSDYLSVYSISDNKIVAEWVLSAGNGNKTVYCEIMTHFGITPTISCNIIARYKELTYKIAFYSSDADKIPCSMYNGYPVISTNQLYITSDDVTSINSDRGQTNTITFYVTFDDANYLNQLLELNNIDRWSASDSLYYDLVLPGKTLFNQPLEKITAEDIVLDFNNLPVNASKFNEAVYKGTFTIVKSDGFDNKDGLATIVLRIPSPCLVETETYECPALYKTAADIKDKIATEVNALVVTNESFYQNYNKELLCSFMTPSCINGEEPAESYVDDNEFELEEIDEISCEPQYWIVSSRSEPCYYLVDALNNTNWYVESPIFQFNFADSRIDYLRFSPDTSLDDIVIMVKPNDSISILDNGCSVSSSSSNANGKIGRSITITIPTTAFIFKHSNGSGIYYCHGPTECNIPSAAKIIKDTNNITLGNIEEGSYTNTGTDGTTSWSINTALGKNYDPNSSNPGSGVLLVDLQLGIARQELSHRGYITSNGILSYKLLFIPSGIGYVNLNMSCGVTCEE